MNKTIEQIISDSLLGKKIFVFYWQRIRLLEPCDGWFELNDGETNEYWRVEKHEATVMEIGKIYRSKGYFELYFLIEHKREKAKARFGLSTITFV